MAAKKKRVASLEDIQDLLAKTDLLLSSERSRLKKAQKEKAKCKRCQTEGKLIHYKGLCKECFELERDERIDAKQGKRWFSTNGQEYTYDEQGNPVLYGRYRMEQILGRPLQEHEQVARLDGDKRNNADHNLILVAKPGINLLELKCECGRHYFNRGQDEPQQSQDQDKS